MAVDPLVPSGPRKIAAKNQISIPSEYLAEIGVRVGDDVFIAVNPDRPGTLVIIPRLLMSDIFRKGWTAAS